MKELVRHLLRGSRIYLVCLMFAIMAMPASAQIRLIMRGDFQFCVSEITNQRCVQIPVSMVDPVGGTPIGLISLTVKMEGDADELVDRSSGNYWVTNFRQATTSPTLTGITNPPTDLSNPSDSPASPDCSGVDTVNPATEGQGPLIDFITYPGLSITPEIANSIADPPGGRRIVWIGFDTLFTTTRDEEVLLAVLELPITGNPNAFSLSIRGTTDAETPSSNGYQIFGQSAITPFDVTEAQASIVVTGPPTVSTQPINQTDICTGDTVQFTTASDTGGTLNYQWQKDTVDIPGATSATLTLNNVTAASAGSYRCRISSDCGSVNSNAASLTIQPGVTLNQQPANADVCEGNAATFTVDASGDGAISYQWLLNGSPIGGATATSYTINSTAQGDEGTYSCRITSNCGTITSAGATLNVAVGPAVTTQPSVSGGFCLGATATLTVAGSTESSLSYQWLKDSNPMDGETSATLTLSNLSAGDAADYACRLTDNCGQVTSNTATVAILGDVSILSASGDVEACPGESATFTVTADGDGPITYQWRLDGDIVPGATNATLSIATVGAGDAGVYTCDVIGPCNQVTSGGARLFSTFEAQITAPTLSQGLEVLVLGSDVICGAPEYSYSWTVVGDAAVIGTDATLALDPAPQDTTAYQLTVTDGGANEASDQVTVLVNDISLDPDGDGNNDLDDLYFLCEEWSQGSLTFDVDGDGFLRVIDIIHFNWGVTP